MWKNKLTHEQNIEKFEFVQNRVSYKELVRVILDGRSESQIKRRESKCVCVCVRERERDMLFL